MNIKSTSTVSRTVFGTIVLSLVLLFCFAGSAAALKEITAEEALALAFEDAKVTAEEAVLLESSSETDDGVTEYEFEFAAGGKKYEYEISADGVIREVEIRELPKMDELMKAAETGRAEVTPEDAFERCCRDAGVSAEEAVLLEFKTESKKNAVRYELDFFADGNEYEYEINADTGVILEKEVKPLP